MLFLRDMSRNLNSFLIQLSPHRFLLRAPSNMKIKNLINLRLGNCVVPGILVKAAPAVHSSDVFKSLTRAQK